MSLQSSLAFRFFCVGSGLHLGNGYWKAFGTDSQLARSFTMQKFAVLVCDSWLRRIRQVWSVQLCQKIFKHARCYCKGGTLSVLSLRIGQLRVNSVVLLANLIFRWPVNLETSNFALVKSTLSAKHPSKQTCLYFPKILEISRCATKPHRCSRFRFCFVCVVARPASKFTWRVKYRSLSSFGDLSWFHPD